MDTYMVRKKEMGRKRRFWWKDDPLVYIIERRVKVHKRVV